MKQKKDLFSVAYRGPEIVSRMANSVFSDKSVRLLVWQDEHDFFYQTARLNVFSRRMLHREPVWSGIIWRNTVSSTSMAWSQALECARLQGRRPSISAYSARAYMKTSKLRCQPTATMVSCYPVRTYLKRSETRFSLSCSKV
jgi:hypothetical protein